MCSFVGPAHHVEVCGILAVVGAGHCTDLACVIVFFNVMAVSVALVLVLGNTERVLLVALIALVELIY